jgi:hypothetical protein
MKSMIVLALTLFSVSSFAQNVQVVSVQPGSKTYIQALVPTQVICESAKVAPMGHAPGEKLVQFFRADNCEADFISSVSFTGNYQVDEALCRSKAKGTDVLVWGVKVDGRCIDVQDTDFLKACIGQI